MAAHVAWKGYLRLSLVSLPVCAYSASNAAQGEIHLNQLHEKCKSRIRYKKTCPIHGEVTNDEIVMGYEFDKDQYVIVDTEEIGALRSEQQKNIRIDVFIREETIPPVFYSGRSYFLAPDGDVGQKPYNLIRDSMAEQGLRAVAQAVISNREQLVVLWPLDNLIAMTVLDYQNQVKDPAGFREQIAETDFSEQEQKLTRQLIDEMLDDSFDLGKYRDDYTDKLRQLIEAKVQGRELVSPPEPAAPPVINLMDALRKSMQEVGKSPKPAERKAAANGSRAEGPKSREENPLSQTGKTKPVGRSRKQEPKKVTRRKSG